MPPEKTIKTGNAAQIVPEAEPVGAVAPASTIKTAKAAADKAAAPRQESKAAAAPPRPAAAPRPRRYYGLLPLFAAAAGGAALALLGAAGLQQAGFYPGAARPQPPAAPLIAAEGDKEAVKAQIEALFAQKSRLLGAQTAEAAQIVQNIANQAEQNRAAAPAAADSEAMARRLAGAARAQAANSRAIDILKDRIAVDERRNQDLMFKTNALREEVALLYAKGQQAQGETARLLALQNLQAAFDSGAPYAAELQLFSAALPQALAAPMAAFTPAQPEPGAAKEAEQKPPISQPAAGAAAPGAVTIGAALARYQAAGLPNKAVLARDFTLLADRLAAQGLEDSPDNAPAAGWRNRLGRWIMIRPQGPVAGKAAAAGLARLEAALAEGDYKSALAEADALPPPLQKAIRPYSDIIRLRLAADNFFRHTAQAIFVPAGALATADKSRPVPEERPHNTGAKAEPPTP